MDENDLDSGVPILVAVGLIAMFVCYCRFCNTDLQFPFTVSDKKRESRDIQQSPKVRHFTIS